MSEAKMTVVCTVKNCGGVMDPCAPDGSVYAQPEQAPDASVRLRYFICPQCGAKSALMFEMDAMTQHAHGWVENELRTSGYFFPSDFTGSGQGPKGW